MRRFWICNLADGRAGCPPHKRIYSLWNRPESLFLTKVQHPRKKSFRKGLTNLGEFGNVMKSSERDAAHQIKRRHRIQSFQSFPGAYDVMEPLRSIPNSVVKRCYGEDTRRVTAR